VHHTKNHFAICTHRYGPQPTHPLTYPSTKPSAKSAWFFKGMQKERNKIEMMASMIRIYVLKKNMSFTLDEASIP
jgi:hypothetical protein